MYLDRKLIGKNILNYFTLSAATDVWCVGI